MTDYNRTDEQGRKQRHWVETEFPENDELLSTEGDYVDGKKHGQWIFQFADDYLSRYLPLLSEKF